MPEASPTRLRITLRPEIADLVKDAVASGEYGSDSEVIGEALQEWNLLRMQNLGEPDELRRL